MGHRRDQDLLRPRLAPAVGVGLGGGWHVKGWGAPSPQPLLCTSVLLLTGGFPVWEGGGTFSCGDAYAVPSRASKSYGMAWNPSVMPLSGFPPQKSAEADGEPSPVRFPVPVLATHQWDRGHPRGGQSSPMPRVRRSLTPLHRMQRGDRCPFPTFPGRV